METEMENSTKRIKQDNLLEKFRENWLFVNSHYMKLIREHLLHIASENQYKESEKFILENCSVNFNGKNFVQQKSKPFAEGINSTLLQVAARNGHTEIVNALLENGIKENIDFQNNVGHTALYLASMYGYTNIVKTLLDYGANVNICRDNGNGPLYIATSGNHFDICKLLLKNGADVNKKGNEEHTPLHTAVADNLDNSERLVDLFIKYGVNVNAINYEKCTPLDYAIENNNTNIIKKLRDVGAKTNKCRCKCDCNKAIRL